MNQESKKNFNSNNSSPGYALLLAVVITSAVLSTASAMAGIILSEIRQTRQINGAISAYAQAEEATERALFLLRQSEMPLAELTPPMLPAGTAIVPYNDAQHFSISENDFVALPIPADDTAFTAPKIIAWDFADRCQNTSWIEVTTVSWNNPVFRTDRRPYSRASDFDSNAGITAAFPPGTPVEMRIRALYCDITNLAVENIPGRYRIVSNGQAGDVRQAIETFITRKPPAVGLFDFVLFSECEVMKGSAQEPVCS